MLDEDRNAIGSVVDTMCLPEQNLIVVETMGREVLIPFVDAHILLFDVEDNILNMINTIKDYKIIDKSKYGNYQINQIKT